MEKKRIIEMLRKGKTLGIKTDVSSLREKYEYIHLGETFYDVKNHLELGIYSIDITFDIVGEETEYILLEEIDPTNIALTQDGYLYNLSTTIKGLYVDELTVKELSHEFYLDLPEITDELRTAKLLSRDNSYTHVFDNNLFINLLEGIQKVIRNNQTEISTDIYFTPQFTGEIMFEEIEDEEMSLINTVLIDTTKINGLSDMIQNVSQDFLNSGDTVYQLPEYVEPILNKYWMILRDEVYKQLGVTN